VNVSLWSFPVRSTRSLSGTFAGCLIAGWLADRKRGPNQAAACSVYPTDAKLQETDSANARLFVGGGRDLRDNPVCSVSDTDCSPPPTSRSITIQVLGRREFLTFYGARLYRARFASREPSSRPSTIGSFLSHPTIRSEPGTAASLVIPLFRAVKSYVTRNCSAEQLGNKMLVDIETAPELLPKLFAFSLSSSLVFPRSCITCVVSSCVYYVMRCW